MSDRPGRPLTRAVASALSVALALGALTLGAGSPADADELQDWIPKPLTGPDLPRLYPERHAGIPCLTAETKEEYDALECNATLLPKYRVPDDVVSEQILDTPIPNCSAQPLSPASPSGTWDRSVDVGSWDASGTSYAYGESDSHTEGGGGKGSVGFSLFGLVNIGGEGGGERSDTSTQSEEWSQSETLTLVHTARASASRTDRVQPYSWGYWVWKGGFNAMEMLWTWKDATTGLVASSVHTTWIPVLTQPTAKTDPTTGEPILPAPWGLLDFRQLPMTPAEIEYCVNHGRAPAAPLLRQPALMYPQGDTDLTTLPFLFATTSRHLPILRNVGYFDPTAPGGDNDPRAEFVPVKPRAMNNADVTEVYRTLEKSLTLQSPSEVGFWLGGNCSVFETTIANNGWLSGSQVFEVWAGSMVNGVPVATEKLDFQLLQERHEGYTPERLPAFSMVHQMRTDIPAGTDVLILKGVRQKPIAAGGGWNPDMPFTSLRDDKLQGFYLDQPRLQCGERGDDPNIASAYTAPIDQMAVDLAATRDEARADSRRFDEPDAVTYGYEECRNNPARPNAPVPWSPLDPMTIINQACGGTPLTVRGTVYGSGIGTHSNAVVEWRRTHPTCRTLTMGFGFDDVEGTAKLDERHDHTVKVYVDGVLRSTTALHRNGSSGVVRVNHDLALGPHTITVAIDAPTASLNGWGHVNIIEPTLHCDDQAATKQRSTVQQRSLAETPEAPAPRAGDTTVVVSSLPRFGETVSWGSIQSDVNIDGEPIRIAGRQYPSGISAHADSRFDIYLGGRCTSFRSDIGVDDSAGDSGSVQFEVLAGDERLAHSEIVRGSDPTAAYIVADVAGVEWLTLATTHGGDSIDFDHSTWAGAVLTCVGAEAG